MAVDRETWVEVAVSVIGVGGFIATAVAVGMVFGDGGLSETGGLALVALIVAFVLVMSATGYWLSGREG